MKCVGKSVGKSWQAVGLAPGEFPATLAVVGEAFQVGSSCSRGATESIGS